MRFLPLTKMFTRMLSAPQDASSPSTDPLIALQLSLLRSAAQLNPSPQTLPPTGPPQSETAMTTNTFIPVAPSAIAPGDVVRLTSFTHPNVYTFEVDRVAGVYIYDASGRRFCPGLFEGNVERQLLALPTTPGLYTTRNGNQSRIYKLDEYGNWTTVVLHPAAISGVTTRDLARMQTIHHEYTLVRLIKEAY